MSVTTTTTTTTTELRSDLRAAVERAFRPGATRQDVVAWRRALRRARKALGYRPGMRLANLVIDEVTGVKRTPCWPDAKSALGTDEEAWCADLDW